MNRIIKFVLLILICVISFSSANMVKDSHADKKIADLYDVKNYQQIFIPSSINTNRKLLRLIEGVSKKKQIHLLSLGLLMLELIVMVKEMPIN